jgi:hypothetical protein
VSLICVLRIGIEPAVNSVLVLLKGNSKQEQNTAAEF